MLIDINIYSSSWCNIIFTDNKNKTYGAYHLRKNSWKGYVIGYISVVIILILTCIIIDLNMNNIREREVIVYSFPDTALPEEITDIYIYTMHLPPPVHLHSIGNFAVPGISNNTKINNCNEKEKEDGTNCLNIEFESNNEVEEECILIEELELLQTPIVNIGTDETRDPHPNPIERMPQFPGGDSELMKYLSENIRYPYMAAETETQGRVFVRFMVQRDGSISGIHILKSLHPHCDKEVIRVISGMPKWIPARSLGRNVSVSFTLPVQFKLLSYK